MAAKANQIWGTGRRKTSVARVKLTPGSGKVTVNKRAFEVYFPLESQRVAAKQPLAVTGNADKFDMLVLVKGGPGSRLLERAVLISEWGTNRVGQPLKILSTPMRDVFGGFGGRVSLQRSPPRWVDSRYVGRAADFVRSLP